MTTKDKKIRFTDLVTEGLASGRSQTKFFVDLYRYKKGEWFKNDGFKSWTACLNKLLPKIRRARSTVHAKLNVVIFLVDSGNVTLGQIEKMGDTNASHLARLAKHRGLSKKWVQAALRLQCEAFKEEVSKAIKPHKETSKRLTTVLPVSIYHLFQEQFGRIQRISNTEQHTPVWETITAILSDMSDDQIHEAATGEQKPPKQTKKK